VPGIPHWLHPDGWWCLQNQQLRLFVRHCTVRPTGTFPSLPSSLPALVLMTNKDTLVSSWKDFALAVLGSSTQQPKATYQVADYPASSTTTKSAPAISKARPTTQSHTSKCVISGRCWIGGIDVPFESTMRMGRPACTSSSVAGSAGCRHLNIPTIMTACAMEHNKNIKLTITDEFLVDNVSKK
jgi:hypothetical protein